MSDWGRALQDRIAELEEATARIDAADDSYLDTHHRHRLESAREEINDVIADTQDEVDLINADWDVVVEQTEAALGLLDDAIERLVDAGFVEVPEGTASHRRLNIVVDDPPQVVLDMQDELQMLDSHLRNLRDAAHEMQTEKDDLGTTGGW